MIKFIAFVKRREDLTREQFREYYETKHRHIGDKHHRGNALKYVRRYLEAMPHPVTGETVEPEYDVIMETWFENQEKFDYTMSLFAAPDTATLLIEDEKKFVDRSKTRFYFVQECESDL